MYCGVGEKKQKQTLEARVHEKRGEGVQWVKNRLVRRHYMKEMLVGWTQVVMMGTERSYVLQPLDVLGKK